MMPVSHALLPCAGAIALSCLMLVAGVAKLRHPAWHARAIDAYALLPAGAGRWCAPLLGALECAAGVALWLPPARNAAALAVLALLLLYTGAIGLNLLRGHRDIDCGCGGRLRHVPLSGWLLARNAVLALVALLVWSAPALVPGDPGTWAGAFAIAAVAALAYNGLNFLLSRDTLLQDD